PSLSSAISIKQSYWDFKTQQLKSWTETDWYTTDRSTGDVIEYQGTSRHMLAMGSTLLQYYDLSASIDPHTGSAEAFFLWNVASDEGVLLVDSSGNLHWLNSPGQPGLLSNLFGLSATRDGHVYYVCPLPSILGGGVYYEDSNGNYTNLGFPNPGVAVPPNGGWDTSLSPVAASQWSGGNEVFVIGNDGYIYLNLGKPG